MLLHRPSWENVIVSDSVVHRWGVIESEGACRAILTTADGVPGVKRVENHLEYPASFRPGTRVRPATRTQAVEAALHLSEHFCAADCTVTAAGPFTQASLASGKAVANAEEG
jgi:hypothetical protein